MKKGKLVKSVLVTVDIDEVRDSKDAFLYSCFTEEEREELNSRHIRSTAGRLALKRAVQQLVAGKKAPDLTERDIVLGRGTNGRPELLSLGGSSTGSVPGGLFVSISHTKNSAYGLAVLQED